MTLASLGAGNVGAACARSSPRGGETVAIGVPEPAEIPPPGGRTGAAARVGTVGDAIDAAHLRRPAVPYGAALARRSRPSAATGGRILVDPTNPIAPGLRACRSARRRAAPNRSRRCATRTRRQGLQHHRRREPCRQPLSARRGVHAGVRRRRPGAQRGRGAGAAIGFDAVDGRAEARRATRAVRDDLDPHGDPLGQGRGFAFARCGAEPA